MSDDVRHRLPRRPHNPGLRDLVAGKRQWSPPLPAEAAARGFRGWHERGYLPHRDAPGLTQFVTFRLADSFPAQLRSEWAGLLAIEDERQRRMALEAYLDRGPGACVLRHDAPARIAEDALSCFHHERYDLHAWVVMPNHVHVLFRVGDTPMSDVVESWKKYTAHAINKTLRRRGKLWAEDYWDTYMRDGPQEARCVRYIEANPVKAFLVRDPQDWPWSSARFRDQAGVLWI